MQRISNFPSLVGTQPSGHLHNSTRIAVTTSLDIGSLFTRKLFSFFAQHAMAQKTVAYTTGVTPGSYTSADITVDNQGLITTVASGAAVSNVWLPSDYLPGGLVWTGDPILSGTATMTSGQMRHQRIKLATSLSVTSVSVYFTINSATFTAGQCFVGIYQGNTLVASSADQAAAWQGSGTGYKTAAMVGAPIALSAGFIDVVILENHSAGSLQVGSYTGSTTTPFQIQFSAPNFRAGIQAGLTALPANLNSTLINSVGMWFILS